jgi:uncharacterized damage-inducible protein DinB
MANEDPVREQLARLLTWSDAHVSLDDAVADLPVALRGAQPAGLPYSPWQLLEHIRLAQRDILDFCANPEYEEQSWPDDYWPAAAAPPSEAAWDESLEGFRRDLAALQALARDPAVRLTDRVPNGNGQTYLRELVLAADHTAYHVGELVVVRRLLGAWKRG